MNKLSVKDVDLKGKRVFIRVDFNVPLDDDGNVTDTTRIDRALPTIQLAIDQGARVIVASHLGRPKGQVKPEFSLRQVVDTFSDHLGKPVQFCDECVGPKAEKAVAELNAGDVLLLENLRFHKEETANDEAFSRSLASLADVYVNNAFGTAHRAHASIEGITRFISPAVSGFLLQREIEYFNKAMTNPERPLAAILGGAKVSTKFKALEKLIDTCDIMLVGGGMAFTFLKASGYQIGDNILEEEMVDSAKAMMVKAKERGVKLYLPVDFVVADEFNENANTDVVTFQELPKGKPAPDIGPASIELFKLALRPARTIVWNGPMGVFEMAPFAKGTMAIVDAMANSDALTVVGGGDSVTAVNVSGMAEKMDFLSTGGGAFLEMMEGKLLPGIAALTDA